MEQKKEEMESAKDHWEKWMVSWDKSEEVRIIMRAIDLVGEPKTGWAAIRAVLDMAYSELTSLPHSSSQSDSALFSFSFPLDSL